ncbi:MAG: hypothetical protein K0Q71_5562 [Thermomicrobiales bacterium]|jgi:hypothetical protein|nr:hypothetical protein [Thermomicrobiales bacterium]
MKTVHGWVGQVYPFLEIPQQELPSDDERRLQTPAVSIDAVFVLKKGFMYFDNVPIGFFSAQHRAQNPGSKWIFADSPSGNLLLMFLFIQGATANIEGRWLNALPYLSGFSVGNAQWGA